MIVWGMIKLPLGSICHTTRPPVWPNQLRPHELFEVPTLGASDIKSWCLELVCKPQMAEGIQRLIYNFWEIMTGRYSMLISLHKFMTHICFDTMVASSAALAAKGPGEPTQKCHLFQPLLVSHCTTLLYSSYPILCVERMIFAAINSLASCWAHKGIFWG